MGFLSWTTGDTKESIPNQYVNHANSGMPIYLLQPNGRESICFSLNAGYGTFVECNEWGAERDINLFAWFALVNLPHIQKSNRSGLTAWLKDEGIDSTSFQIDRLDLEKDSQLLTSLGLSIMYNKEFEFIYPIKLSFNENAIYENCNSSELCKFQGYFYDN